MNNDKRVVLTDGYMYNNYEKGKKKGVKIKVKRKGERGKGTRCNRGVDAE